MKKVKTIPMQEYLSLVTSQKKFMDEIIRYKHKVVLLGNDLNRSNLESYKLYEENLQLKRDLNNSRKGLAILLLTVLAIIMSHLLNIRS